MVKDINPGAASSSPEGLAVVNGRLYFRAFEPTAGTELWRSDGTAAGTTLVKDINPGVADSLPFSITALGGRAFFSAFEPATGTDSGRVTARRRARRSWPTSSPVHRAPTRPSWST